MRYSVIFSKTSLKRFALQSDKNPWGSMGKDRKVGMMGVSNANKADLLTIRELLKMGTVVSVIDRRYPLSETAEAIRYLERGHARVKVIITVAE